MKKKEERVERKKEKKRKIEVRVKSMERHKTIKTQKMNE